MDRRTFLMMVGGGTTGLIAGCMTPHLFHKETIEKVSSVLITQDGKQLVVIGEEFHYVFDAPKGLVETLSSSFRQYAYVRQWGYEFNVDDGGNVTGEFDVALFPAAPEADVALAFNLGYTQAQNDVPVLHCHIKGRALSGRWNRGDTAGADAKHQLCVQGKQ